MINRKDFLNGNFKIETKESEEHPIADFLRKNRNRAYTNKEIRKALKIGESSIRFWMKKLIAKKLVIHKKPYYLWK